MCKIASNSISGPTYGDTNVIPGQIILHAFLNLMMSVAGRTTFTSSNSESDLTSGRLQLLNILSLGMPPS